VKGLCSCEKSSHSPSTLSAGLSFSLLTASPLSWSKLPCTG
jgi:hypothetical protein